jgi:hypothetical protein
MRPAQKEVPERRVALAVEPTEHLDDVVAGQRDREGAHLVAPEDVARGEEDRERQPGKVERQPEAALGRRRGVRGGEVQRVDPVAGWSGNR